MNVDKTLINIPFMGFYNSLLEGEIDHAIRSESEYQEQELDGIPASEFSEILYRYADFSKCRNEIAKKYVDHFSNLLSEHLEFDGGIELEFESMTSPREYNFSTDRIFAYIPESTIKELFDCVNVNSLQETINLHLKSRSGFISFYSEFVDDWKEKPLNTWDCNELSMLLFCILEEIDDHDLSIYYRMSEDVYSAFQNCVDWQKVENAVNEWKEENEVTK